MSWQMQVKRSSQVFMFISLCEKNVFYGWMSLPNSTLGLLKGRHIPPSYYEAVSHQPQARVKSVVGETFNLLFSDSVFGEISINE